MLEQTEQPVKRVGQLVPSPVGVEQSEDVQRNDRVGVWLFCIEVHLWQWISGGASREYL